MVFEKTIRYRLVKPAQADFAPVAPGFSRQEDCERALWFVAP